MTRLIRHVLRAFGLYDLRVPDSSGIGGIAEIILTDLRGLKSQIDELAAKMVTREEMSRVESTFQSFVPRAELSQRFLAIELAAVEGKADRAAIDKRVTILERQLLPTWVLPVLGTIIGVLLPIILVVISHYWTVLK